MNFNMTVGKATCRLSWPTRGGTRGTLYPGPVGAGVRITKPAASVTMNLFVNLGMVADSDYYANKLYKFRRGLEKPGGPVQFSNPLAQFFSEALLTIRGSD